MSNKEAYLDAVCEQIRFKAARKMLRQELDGHIEDRKAEFEKHGAADAEAEAIRAMGDAKTVGKGLNAIHKPRFEWGVIICVLLLSAAGVAAAYAGSWHPYDDYGQGWWPYVQSSLPIYFSLGIYLMIGMVLIDYTLLFRLRHVFLGIAFLASGFCLLLFIITCFAPPPFDKISWLNYPRFYSLPFFILGAAGCINRNMDAGIKGTIRTTLLCVVSAFAISLFSPESSLLFALSYVAMMFANYYNAKQQKKWLHFSIAAGIIAVILVPYLYLSLTYTGTYITTQDGGTRDIVQIHNIFSISRYSHQMLQDTLKGASFVGAAPQLTQIQSQEWLSYGSSSAYVFTAVIGAYGWLTAAAILLAFLALFALMIRRCLKIADPFGRLLASGITSLFFVRFALFILSGTVFANGISSDLPFLSSCSSNYICDVLLIGIFLSVWRRSSFMTKGTLLSVKRKKVVIKLQS